MALSVVSWSRQSKRWRGVQSREPRYQSLSSLKEEEEQGGKGLRTQTNCQAKKEPHEVWLFYQTRQARGSGTTRRAGCYVDGGCAATVAA